ncbi:MAG: hypothetical protein H0V46_09170 [Sphingomonas sp.]|nr:hypothetical protein [Sphingomonas sp.]
MAVPATALRILRVVYGLFFLAIGVAVLVWLLTGLGSPPTQPNAEAQAFTDALTRSRIIDPLLAISYVVGGAALLRDRTAPLGLVLLAPSVLVIALFHLVLSGQWLIGLVVALVFAVLAFASRRRLSTLWAA